MAPTSRSSSRREAKGKRAEPVSDWLAARVPVIVSELGWAAERRGRWAPLAADCSAQELARAMAEAADDDGLRAEIRAAQDH